MDELLIKCPNCGAIIQIKNMPNIEKASVKCPICQERSAVRDCKRVNNVPQSEETDLNIRRGSREHTKYRNTEAQNLGRLRVLDGSNATYKLKLGRNIIGRKASVTKADIQLQATQRMSREHLIIDVQEEMGNTYSHRASLYKEHVNNTYIGASRLEYGDRVRLHNGDIIRLPDLDITIEM